MRLREREDDGKVDFSRQCEDKRHSGICDRVKTSTGGQGGKGGNPRE